MITSNQPARENRVIGIIIADIVRKGDLHSLTTRAIVKNATPAEYDVRAGIPLFTEQERRYGGM